MNKDTFYLNTKATFKGCRRPSRKPDYTSFDRDGNISSEYWYTKDGVYRNSNHWSIIYLNGKDVCFLDMKHSFTCKKISSCFWRLNCSKSKTTCGFASWSAFRKMK